MAPNAGFYLSAANPSHPYRYENNAPGSDNVPGRPNQEFNPGAVVNWELALNPRKDQWQFGRPSENVLGMTTLRTPFRLAWIVAAVTGGAIALVVWASGLLTSQPPAREPTAVEIDVDQQRKTARDLLANGKFVDALQAAELCLRAAPQDTPALLVAGEAATRLSEYDEALQFYSQVAPADPENYALARLSMGEIERVRGEIDRAMELFAQALQSAPGQPGAVDRLAGLLAMTEGMHSARPLLMQIVRSGTATVEQLQWLADPDRPILALDFLEYALNQNPNQPQPHAGVARIWLSRGDIAQARQHIDQARQQSQGDAEIEAIHGQMLLDSGAVPAWKSWLTTLPEWAQSHPSVWLQRGIVAEQEDQSEIACRCWLEALSLAPDRREIVFRAGTQLRKCGESQLGEALIARSQRLNEAATLAASIHPERPNGTACRQLAETMLALGRCEEAAAWGVLALEAGPQHRPWFEDLRHQIRARLVKSGTFAEDKPLVAARAARSRFPAPTVIADQTAASAQAVAKTGPIASAAPPAAGPEAGTCAFVDEAQERGLVFRYNESPDQSTPGRRMFEFTGGGVAVLDFDQDDWPDIYFPQGGQIVEDRPAETDLDQLFRNRAGTRFENVTRAGGIAERGFSQGATAGDFNNDGFPDLYVANLGRNRLFENLGDGTFEERLLPDDSAWTTSCAIADLNQDAIPDLVDVNYLQGDDIWSRLCDTPAGPRVCTPLAFEAAPNRLCLGNGDGTFRDASGATQFAASRRKSLGLLIGPLGPDERLGIFVANDTEPNSLFVNENPAGAAPLLLDLAPQLGVAWSDSGQAQACMGVAAADFDGNGRLDLHITNYFNEPNSLYLAQSDGSFVDSSRLSGLFGPSLPMLGFGTQAVDVDADGDWDLVVANGDLDDFTHEGRQFQMPPQLFLNQAHHFRLEQPQSHRDYFSTASSHRGRGLATLDWNRDGRVDLAISHLDEPAALVSNTSAQAGTVLTVRLVGVRDSRDAIGARASFAGQVNFVMTGDGYMSRNEQLLRWFRRPGAGDETLNIIWPNGDSQSVSVPKTTNTLIVTQAATADTLTDN